MWFWTLIQRMVSSFGFPHHGDLRVTLLYRYMHKVSSRHRQYSRKPLGPKKNIKYVKHIQLRDCDGRRMSSAANHQNYRPSPSSSSKSSTILYVSIKASNTGFRFDCYSDACSPPAASVV